MFEITDVQLPVLPPRAYQIPLWKYMQGGGKRAVAVWHRRCGKDLTAMNITATLAMERVGLYWHLLPTYNQGRKIAWNGMDRTGKKFRDAFPKELVVNENKTEMTVELSNGSIWQVAGTDNIDNLVGANPIGCVFSEYSLQDPRAWDLIRPILAENGGWAMFIYTPRGYNHGFTLFEMSKKNKAWFSQILTVEDSGAIPLKAVEDEREAGMTEDLVQQEFYCSFDAALKGSYYGDLINKLKKKNQICKVPWEPISEVHTSWDLGISDSTSIIFFQEIGKEIRIIDYYDNEGEGLAHYAKYLKEKPYVYGEHFAPHDIMVRELGTGKSRYEVAASLGMRFKVAPKLSLEDGIEAVRNILPRCWFHEEKPVDFLINALSQYKKEFDEKRQVFRSAPVHDWTSHPSDAFRIMAVSRRTKVKRETLPDYADGEYSILGGQYV